jgi:hypothetical protein
MKNLITLTIFMVASALVSADSNSVDDDFFSKNSSEPSAPRDKEENSKLPAHCRIKSSIPDRARGCLPKNDPVPVYRQEKPQPTVDASRKRVECIETTGDKKTCREEYIREIRKLKN